MSGILKKIKKVLYDPKKGILQFQNEHGITEAVLTVNKVVGVKNNDFKEILENLEFRFKIPKA